MRKALLGKLLYVCLTVEMPCVSKASDKKITQISQPQKSKNGTTSLKKRADVKHQNDECPKKLKPETGSL
ncbi:MAG: hypothetical protein HY089_03100 [Ignavibacteriales bacterium]|nr:hypothetical protein [Ignavibacteriales bacterium]